MGFLANASSGDLLAVKWLYLSSFSVCIFALSIALLVLFGSKTVNYMERIMRKVFIMAIVYLIMDATLGFLDLFSPHVSFIIVYAVFLLDRTVKLAFSFLLARYFKEYMGLKQPGYTALFWAVRIVGTILLIAAIVLGKTPFFLSRVDGRLIYGAGDRLLLWTSYVLLIYLLVRILYLFPKPALYANRRELLLVLKGFAVAAPYMILQNIAHNIPLAFLGATLTCMVVFVSEISDSVSRDSLTDLDNEKQLLKTMDRLLREKGPWSLILIDIDQFAQINEKYGYSEGDMALILMAGIVDDSRKMIDSHVYRRGSNCFAILCKHRSVSSISAEVAQICSRLRLGMRDYNAGGGGRGYAIEISIGFAWNEAGDTIPDILKRAQNMLDSEKYGKYEYLNVEDEEFDDESFDGDGKYLD